MFPGEAVGSRFVIEDEAGSGGMGTVYRAWDRQAKVPVAVKILRAQSNLDGERFTREAALLANLIHPGIVRYVAHGTTSLGAPYLAMEWLQGQTLSERFAERRLTMPEAVALGLRVADALAVAHQRGVVHRDIKPGNLFLPDGDIGSVKVVDFGIARHTHDVQQLTGTGVLVGTPGYMAPEQARGVRDVDARADVFALGCVLYESVTGQAAFVGEQMMGLLAKILLDDVVPARELAPQVPARLDDLIGRMLSKDPEARPSDGAEVVGALKQVWDELGKPEADVAVRPPRRSLGRNEQRIICVILAQHALPAEHYAGDAPTIRQAATGSADEETLRSHAARFGGRMEVVADGSIAVTLQGAFTATDQAAMAARCALALREVLPQVPIAVATGRAVVQMRIPVGEAIDRAARLLVGRPPNVWLDEATAGLLDNRFDVAGDQSALFLRAELEIEATRTLLGKPTHCVGRDRELDLLDATFVESIAEPVARAVLITGPPGVGKSRIRYEFIRRVRETSATAEIFFGRGESLGAGSPFGMLAPAIRYTAGIVDGEPLDVRRRKLRARLSRHLPIKKVDRVCEFLGEMVGVPFDERSEALRTARHDAKLMGDAMRVAWEEWLAAECDGQPVVVVLEDLHWGDLPSVKLVDAALRNLFDKPLMVLALARPDVHTQFPALWSERDIQEIRLGPLTRKAADRLVREVLGEEVAEATVRSIVELADGNPFYLEELIRAVAGGKTDLPATVLGMVQARLDGLGDEGKRVLRAASIFGERFWLRGVLALVGERQGGVPECLEDLIAREIIIRRAAATLPGEREYAFRHALLREAAYAMLTESDRALGHRLAGTWLETIVMAGEQGDPAASGVDGVTLAQHFDLGMEPERAMKWWRLGAEQALEGNDLKSAITRAEKAVACGPLGPTLGELHLIRAEAHTWRGERAEAARYAELAAGSLARGTPGWFRALAELIEAACLLGEHARARSWAREAAAMEPQTAEARTEQISTLARAGVVLMFAGRLNVADELARLIEQSTSGFTEIDRRVLGRVRELRALQAYYAGDPEGNLVGLESAYAAYDAAGDLRKACETLGLVGFAYVELGAWDRAEKALREAQQMAEKMGLPYVVGVTLKNLGICATQRGELELAGQFEEMAVGIFEHLGIPRMEGAARRALATVHLLQNDLPAAYEEAQRAVSLLQGGPPKRVGALSVLASVLLASGRHAEALEQARAALQLLGSMGMVDENESLVRLVLAECLDAAGDKPAARKAILEAREQLLSRAGTITDEILRRCFLENVSENVRTLELARQWLGPPLN